MELKKYVILLLALLVLTGCNRSAPVTTNMSTDSETLQSSEEGQVENIHWEKRGDVLTISGEGILTKEHLKEVKKKWKKEIKKVVVKDGITGLGDECFSMWKEMKRIELSDSITTIGEYAFAYCKKMEDIRLPDKLAKVEEYMFLSCKELKQIQLPKELREMERAVFGGCISLERIEIPNGVTELPSYTFIECSKLTDVKLPDSLKKIGEYAFSECTALKQIEIPDSVEEFEKFVFIRCDGLETLTLPGNLKKYPKYAICDCINLKEIVNNSAYDWKVSPSGMLKGPWYCDGENVGRNIPAGKTIVMKPITYKITYDLQGGIVEGESLPDSYQHTEVCQLPRNVKKEGYEFLGWYEEGGYEKKCTEPGDARDLKLYAYWAKFDLETKGNGKIKAKWDVYNAKNHGRLMYCVLRYSEKEDMSDAKIWRKYVLSSKEIDLPKLEKGKKYYVEYAIYDHLLDEILKASKRYDWQGKRSIVAE